MPRALDDSVSHSDEEHGRDRGNEEVAMRSASAEPTRRFSAKCPSRLISPRLRSNDALPATGLRAPHAGGLLDVLPRRRPLSLRGASLRT